MMSEEVLARVALAGRHLRVSGCSERNFPRPNTQSCKAGETNWGKESRWICILVISVFLDDVVKLEHVLVVRVLKGVTVPDSDSRCVLGGGQWTIPRRESIADGYTVGDIGGLWRFRG